MTPELKKKFEALLERADNTTIPNELYKSDAHILFVDITSAMKEAIAEPTQAASDVSGATREELIHTIVVLGRLSERILEQTGQHTAQDPQKISFIDIADRIDLDVINSGFSTDGYSQPVNMNGSSIRFSVVPKMVFPEIFKNDFSDPAWHSNFMVNDQKYSGIIAMIADSEVKSPIDIPNKNIWTSPVDGRLHYIHTEGRHAGWIEALGYMPVDKGCLVHRDYGKEKNGKGIRLDMLIPAKGVHWGDVERFKLA